MWLERINRKLKQHLSKLLNKCKKKSKGTANLDKSGMLEQHKQHKLTMHLALSILEAVPPISLIFIQCKAFFRGQAKQLTSGYRF